MVKLVKQKFYIVVEGKVRVEVLGEMEMQNPLRGGAFKVTAKKVFYVAPDGYEFEVDVDTIPLSMKTLQRYLAAPYLMVYPKGDEEEEE